MSGTQTTDVVTGDGHERRRSRRKLIFVYGGVLLVAVILLGAYLWNKNINSKPAGDFATLMLKAQQQAYDKRFPQAFDTFDAAVEVAATDDDKVTAYVSEVNTALNAKYFDTAVDRGLKLTDIRETPAFDGMVGDAYAGKGDKTKAVEYYRKAVAYQRSHGSGRSNAGANYYNKKIIELTKETP
jgi:tetratricopeptide (TPR) repeat protein